MVPATILVHQWFYVYATPHQSGSVVVQLSGHAETPTHVRVYPMPQSVLSQIAVLITAYKAEGQDLLGITISYTEMVCLKQELGAKGDVAMIEGIPIQVGPISDLPHEVGPVGIAETDMAPDIPSQVQLLGKYLIEKQATSLPAKILDLEFPFGEIHAASFDQAKAHALKTSQASEKVHYVKDPILYVSHTQAAAYKKLQQEVTVPGIDFDAADVAADEEYLEGIDLAMSKAKVKVYHKSGSDEHGTPDALFDTLNQEFHFDLDVCATAAHEILVPDTMTDVIQLDPGNAKCPIYFTQDDDGLSQDWFGSVWMNPPYTKGQAGVWLTKLIHELMIGHITRGVALVAARPDTLWFQHAVSYAYAVRFLKGRLTFQGSVDPAPFPSAVLCFDKSKAVQEVKFWDWKSGMAVKYFQSGKAGGSKPSNPLFLGKGIEGFLGQLLKTKI